MDSSTRRFVLQLVRLGRGMCTAAENWVSESEDIQHITPEEFINELKQYHEVIDNRFSADHSDAVPSGSAGSVQNDRSTYPQR